MSFLYPQFLFGLAALSIPIIIHLFNFRRTKRVFYSNTKFLNVVKEASTSKLKIKHLLILASRLLFIFFLVLAFAQPFIPAEKQGIDSSEVIVYLDNSFSMSNEVGPDFTAFDAGIGFVNELVDLFPQGTNYKYLTNNFNPGGIGFKSKAEILDLITESKLTGDLKSFPEISSRIESELAMSKSGLEKEIFWISDFQRSTLGESASNVLDSNATVNLFPLSYESYTNVYVDSVFFSNPFLLGNNNIVLSVRLANSGNFDVDEIPIKVFINDIQVSNTTVSIRAADTFIQTFDLGDNLEAVNRGRIEIEDFPVTFDNDFYFILDISDRVKVMEIRNNLDPTAIESVYANTDLFTFNSDHVSNIDFAFLNSAHLVIINQLQALDISLINQLNSILSSGKSIVLIPDEGTDFSELSNVSMGRNLVKLDSAGRQELAQPDFANPFFENVFEETAINIGMPEATQVVSWGSDRGAILSFRNGSPFLTRTISAGTTYLFAGPLDSERSSFQNHALFVPVMYKMAFGSKQHTGALYFNTDDDLIQVQVDSVDQKSIFKIIGDDTEFIPNQRIMAGSLIAELPPDGIQPGIYELVLGNDVKGSLAFNHSSDESKLQQLGRNELETIFADANNISIFDVANETEFSNTLKKQYKGTPYWKYALIFGLFFLLLEVAFVRLL